MNTSIIETQILEAADLIVAQMQKGQAFSVKAIDSWIQAAMIATGDRARRIVRTEAQARLVATGAIVRKDGKYAPGVTEGYVLA